MAKFRRRYHRMRPLKPLPFRYVLLLSFSFFMVSTVIAIWIVNKGIEPPLTAYAESQTVNIATHIMNKAIRDEIGEGLNLNDVMISTENNNHYSLDTEKILEVATNISDRILENINAVEDGHVFSTTIATNGEIENVKSKHGEGIKFEVPIGRITDNALLGSLGPNIPIQFQAIGDTEYEIDTIREEQQINSTWYEVRLKLKVGIQIIVPFETKMKVIERNVLLAAGEIKGDVPHFYGGGGQLDPSINVPDTNEGED